SPSKRPISRRDGGPRPRLRPHRYFTSNDAPGSKVDRPPLRPHSAPAALRRLSPELPRGTADRAVLHGQSRRCREHGDCDGAQAGFLTVPLAGSGDIKRVVRLPGRRSEIAQIPQVVAAYPWRVRTISKERTP